MPTQLQIRRGSTTDHNSFTGAAGELTVDTTKDTLRVHDGSTAGGFELARADGSNLNNITSNITFADNSKAIFGTGSDLEIYHDGANSYIKETGTGSLYLDADAFVLRNNADSGKWINCYGDTVVLNYNNSAKLTTTNTGVDVTGVITTDGMTTSADINFGDNDKAVFGAGSDLQIYHDGSHSYVDDQGTGQLRLKGTTQIQFLSGVNDYMATMVNDGAEIGRAHV